MPASEFLSGVQVGANMYENAQRLQLAREQARQQAAQMLVNIRNAQALEEYRKEQSAIQRAEEARRQAMFLDEQKQIEERKQWISERPQRLQQFQSRYDLIPHSMRPTDADFNDQEAQQFTARFAPSAYGAYMSQSAGREASLEREMLRDARLREQFNAAQQGLNERLNKLEDGRNVRLATTIQAKGESQKSRSEIDIAKSLVNALERELKSMKDNYEDDAKIVEKENELSLAKEHLRSLGTTTDSSQNDLTRESPAPVEKKASKFVLKGVR